MQEVLLCLVLVGLGLVVYRLWKPTVNTDSVELVRIQEKCTYLQDDLHRTKAELESLRSDFEAQIAENLSLEKVLAEMGARFESEKQQHLQSKQLFVTVKEQMSKEFQILAAQVLEEKSQSFNHAQNTQLEHLLAPLRTKISEFQSKVEEVYQAEGKERFALGEQVRELLQMNLRLSEDAQNLSRALRGDNKTQGNWGEMILESVLESSGLRKGFEYEVQQSHSLESGSRLQPDVVLHLPESRHLIIDSKLSLLAYEEYCHSSGTDQEIALKKHLDSLRSHIKGLGAKEYDKLHGQYSPDFVLMFVPIESAFMLGISHSSNLWQEAWDKNVLMVSPSTLLFVLRTIAQLWRQENQNKNAQEIARRGAELYDKFCGFLGDYKEVGQRLRMASEAYDKGFGKLSQGKGNLLRQAEMLRELGVKPSKQMPQGYDRDLALEEREIDSDSKLS